MECIGRNFICRGLKPLKLSIEIIAKETEEIIEQSLETSKGYNFQQIFGSKSSGYSANTEGNEMWCVERDQRDLSLFK